jgi:hypothetical protein
MFISEGNTFGGIYTLIVVVYLHYTVYGSRYMANIDTLK